MKALNLQNLGIIAGAVALAFVIHKVATTKKAMESLSNPTDYSPAWSDNITGNKADKYIYV